MSEAALMHFCKRPSGNSLPETLKYTRNLTNITSSVRELLTQFRTCLAIESPDPGTLKQLGYYLDFACQILHVESWDLAWDLETRTRVVGFIVECRDLLNGALAKPLPDFQWQRLAHFVESQTSRIRSIREMAESDRRLQ